MASNGITYKCKKVNFLPFEGILWLGSLAEGFFLLRLLEAFPLFLFSDTGLIASELWKGEVIGRQEVEFTL
jgi:hypothetical protein